MFVGDVVTLVERLAAEIAQRGPLPFGEAMEAALYDPDLGFYSAQGQAGGRRGDFVTSVEVGPLFAAVIGDWLDAQWDEVGQPSPFLVSEVGAGVGTMFRGIVRAAPRCLQAIRYTLVEQSASMRERHEDLPGEQWASASMLPGEHQHVILANELLDNLPFDIAERVTAGWAPVLVGTSNEQPADGLELITGEGSIDLSFLSDLVPEAVVGARVPVAAQANRWVVEAVAAANVVLLFDYAAPTAELASRGQFGWLRTYARHERGSDPLAQLGGHDITADVPLDQLPPPATISSQADWLRANGIEARVAQARALWEERAGIGDLAAIAARSAISEAEALTDPTGLGAFTVLTYRSP